MMGSVRSVDLQVEVAVCIAVAAAVVVVAGQSLASLLAGS